MEFPLNTTNIKWLYKDILSSKGLTSSMRYCLVYYVTLLPLLLLWGVERIKDTNLAYAYFGSLTAILTALLGFKVKQFGKEATDASYQVQTPGGQN